MFSRFSALAAGLLTLSACSRSVPTDAPAAGPALPVHAASVTAAHVPLFTEAPATVRPAERAVIAARLTGTIATPVSYTHLTLPTKRIV